MPVRGSPILAALALVAAAGLTLGIVAALGGLGGTGLASGPEAAALPTPSAVSSPSADVSVTAAPTPAPTAGTVEPASPPATPGPTPPAVPVPVLVGAIGDSLTVAVNAEPRFGDQPQHSWILGDAADDGVESHLERLRALGADPAVVAAAIPGAAIATAVAQAETVVAGLADAGEGPAYVTFELGANDICARSLDTTTSPDAFAANVEAAFTVLATGLPAGSHLLVLSVPDVTRLRTILEDVPQATALHRRYDVCRAVLGEEVALDAILDRIGAYNAALVEACAALAGSAIECRHDLGGQPSSSLFGATFELEDLSSLDYFHPSLRGQARIAEVSWQLTPWSGAAGEGEG